MLHLLIDRLRAAGWTVAVIRPSVDDARGPLSTARILGVGAEPVDDDAQLVDALVSAWSYPPSENRLLCIDDVDLFDDLTLRAVCAALRICGLPVVMTSVGVERLTSGLPEAHFHQLVPWDRHDIDTLIRRTATHGPIPEVLDRLSSLAGGNPGAAAALTASLSDAQLLGLEPMLPVSFTVPLTVHFTSRIPAELLNAAMLVACAPGTAPAVLERAGAALGVMADDFDSLERAGLAEAVRGGLTLRPAGAGFALEAVSTVGDRRRTHRALADATAAVDPARALWHRAQAAGEPNAILADHLERVCDAEARAVGWSSASHVMLRASELSTTTGERGRRLAKAAEYAWLEGSPALSTRLLTEAEELSADPDLRLRIAYVRGSIDVAAGFEDRALRVMTDAVPATFERLPKFEGTALLMRACDAAVASGDVAAAVALGRRAQQELATGADSASSVRLQLVTGTAKVLAEDLDAGLGLVEEVLEACSLRFDQPHALVGMRASLLAGDAASMWSYADLAVDRLMESNNRGLIPFATARRALADVLIGRFRTAVESTVSGVEESDLLGQGNARAEHLAIRALAHARAGDVEHARQAAERAVQLASDYGLAWPGAISIWALGEIELSAGNPHQAFDRFRLLWHGSRHERHPLIATLAAAETVEAAVRAGRPNESDVAMRRLVAWAQATSNAAVAGLVERCTALRSKDGTDIAESFVRALAMHREADRPYDEARTSLAYGAWLRRERRQSESRALLRLAYERFDSIGATAWQANAAQEMRASGDTALRHDVSGTGAQLTAQELAIARLVADGISNRQAAEKLSLSVRTVEYHLRNVFQKLGLRSRTELALRKHVLADHSREKE
jgi:DNA-binding CsgD family transcriptional regulator